MSLLLILFSLGVRLVLPANTIQTYTSNDIESEMIRAVNAVRAEGCRCGGEWMEPASSVRWNDRLEASATSHADEMHQYEFLKHFSRAGENIGERTRAHGYDWRVVGENVARGQHTVEQVVNDWKKSKTHCLVMMNPKFEEMGAANTGHYWVLHMGAHK